MTIMLTTARQPNPAVALEGAMDGLNAVAKAAGRARIPINLELVNLRASQINGCAVCIDGHAKALRKAGESDERVFGVAAWRETTFFTGPERAALALTEALTRLADRPDPVPDALWDEVCEHFDEEQRAGLVLTIASINVWNRLNVGTRQIADGQAWW
jgi:AhpD family alkylhydroperoxidase